jgi:rhamnosyltransferase
LTTHSQISVVVRARDEAPAIGRCLQLLASQELPDGAAAEVIVVDSGSQDGTVSIARAAGADVLSIAPETFTFGGSLNAGAARASGEIVVALSAHAFPLDDGWLARLVEPFADPSVACASGERFWPDGSSMAGPVRQDAALAAEHPEWGYSNAAGAFRLSLWRERPFRTDLPGSEDREWSLHWIRHGYVCVVDPGLLVDHDHTHDPVVSIYRRARREAEGLASFIDAPPYGVGDLAGEWWSDLRFYRSPLKARLSHRRAARMLGAYAGRRRAARRGP